MLWGEESGRKELNIPHATVFEHKACCPASAIFLLPRVLRYSRILPDDNFNGMSEINRTVLRDEM
jgi:hypothetical protein